MGSRTIHDKRISRKKNIGRFWWKVHTAYPAGLHSVFRVTLRKDSILAAHSPKMGTTFIHQCFNRSRGRFSPPPNGEYELDAGESSSCCSSIGNPVCLLVGDDGIGVEKLMRLHIKNVSPVRKQTRTDVLIGRSGLQIRSCWSGLATATYQKRM